MLKQARRAAEGMVTPPTLQLGDAVTPDFPPGSFDAVTSRYVLWTLREPTLALANWRTLLRPGGRLVAVDSTWHAGGIHAGGPPEPGTKQADFRARYDDRVIAALPLAEARTIDDTAALVRAAGFIDVTVTPLHRILELDRQLGVPEGHQVQLQFLITGLAR